MIINSLHPYMFQEYFLVIGFCTSKYTILTELDKLYFILKDQNTLESLTV